MAHKLLIDADPGIGDAVAIALALFDPELDVVGVTATAGRVSGADATQNVQTVVEYLDPPKWPRFGATSEPAPVGNVDFGPPGVTCRFLEGERGLGEFDLPTAGLHSPRDSAKLIIDVVREHPHEVTLLTLGPLTTVHRACELAPDLLDELSGLVCLGGTLTGGDVTAAAEFNVYADPEAARSVLRSPATKTLVPVDVVRGAVLTFDHFDRLSKSAPSDLSRFLQTLLPFAFRAYHEGFGVEGFPLCEVAALTAVARPRFAERREASVDVETAGQLTRGMTVFDRRGINRWQSNMEVVDTIDTQGVLDYFAAVVRRAAT